MKNNPNNTPLEYSKSRQHRARLRREDKQDEIIIGKVCVFIMALFAMSVIIMAAHMVLTYLTQ